jgi:hypothetical protein
MSLNLVVARRSGDQISGGRTQMWDEGDKRVKGEKISIECRSPLLLT